MLGLCGFHFISYVSVMVVAGSIATLQNDATLTAERY